MENLLGFDLDPHLLPIQYSKDISIWRRKAYEWVYVPYFIQYKSPLLIYVV
jgi:hypothetical protein